MTKFFREVKKNTNWIWHDTRPDWLAQGDYSAAPFEIVIPGNDNKLSVYEVNDDQDRIDLVATALAFGRPSNDAVVYIIFDEAVLQNIGIEIKSDHKGTTCDPHVNDWHRDLINFSANKMFEFVKQTLPNVKTDFVAPKKIEQTFAKNCKRYNWQRVNEKKMVRQKDCAE